MDQKGGVPTNKRSKIEEDEITKDYIVQNVDDNSVDKPGYLSVVDLTDDAWLLVFDYLDIEDRTRIARVCRRWRELARISWKIITRLSFQNIFKALVESRKSLRYLLKVILPKCGTCLRSLNLSVDVPMCHRYKWFQSFTPYTMKLIGLHCTSLQELNLSKVRYSLTKRVLKPLAEGLPRLKSLNLKDCNIDDEGLRSALQMLQSLKTLNVGGNDRITGEFFSQAPQSLTEVIAEDCYELTDEGSICLLVERCPNLETIDISHCDCLTGQSITALATNCPKLKRIYFNMSDSHKVLTSHLLTLSNLPLLEELHVDGHDNVTDEVFKELGRHCPVLRSMSCMRCIEITDDALLYLFPCLHLESIHLRSTFITDKGICILAERCPNLETIDISHCSSLTGQSIIALATNCPKLKRIYFNMLHSDNVLTSHFLTLSNLPLLEELHMKWQFNVTDEVFKELGRHCPLLRSISCMGCKEITDDALLYLSPCRHLESINLNWTHVTDEGLNKLSLVHSDLKKVYLRGCQYITHEGVGCLLSAHPNLLELNIEGCHRVTDSVLPILESSLQHRQHTQPLKILLECTSVDRRQAVSLAETIGCHLVEFSLPRL